MYSHHAESLGIMQQYFAKMEGVVALIFGGSVAKGTQRPDSDLDAMVILEDEAYDKRRAAGKTTECLNMCTYEHGYFDVKYMDKAYIMAAAEKGSEPTRNSFLGSRVLFSKDPEIAEIVARIPVFQEAERADKLLSFYANFSLNYHYFWQSCKPEGYMKTRTASEIVYSVYRIFLQEQGKLFQCHRRLEADVEALAGEYAKAAALGRAFSAQMSDQQCTDFVAQFEKISTYTPPAGNLIGSRYLADFEQWWQNPRPLIAEW